MIEEKLVSPGDCREVPLEVGYVGRVSIWNDMVEDFKEIVTFRHGAWSVTLGSFGMRLRMRNFWLSDLKLHRRLFCFHS